MSNQNSFVSPATNVDDNKDGKSSNVRTSNAGSVINEPEPASIGVIIEIVDKIDYDVEDGKYTG